VKYLCELSALLLLVGAGCALTNPTDPYAPIGNGYGPRISGTLSLPDKLEQKMSGPLTLEQCIEIALANNPEIAAVRHDAASAQARRDVAFSAILPKVNALSSYNLFLDDQRLLPPSKNGEAGVFSDDILAADLVVTMPIFTGGRIVSRIKAAAYAPEATGTGVNS